MMFFPKKWLRGFWLNPPPPYVVFRGFLADPPPPLTGYVVFECPLSLKINGTEGPIEKRY